jgi:hypothetical protein
MLAHPTFRSALLAATLLAAPATAQEALYGALPPRDSAYLRFVNTLPADATAQVDTKPAQVLGNAQAQRVGPYTVVESVEGRQVRLTAQSGGRSVELALPVKSGSFQTVLLQRGPDGAPVLHAWTDNAEFNQLRARLSFYNATTDCPAAGLSLASNNSAVMRDVAPGSGSVRSVNPVNAVVNATCEGRSPLPVTLEGMEAGNMYSIWMMPGQDGPQAFLAKDVVTPWRRPPGG